MFSVVRTRRVFEKEFLIIIAELAIIMSWNSGIKFAYVVELYKRKFSNLRRILTYNLYVFKMFLIQRTAGVSENRSKSNATVHDLTELTVVNAIELLYRRSRGEGFIFIFYRKFRCESNTVCVNLTKEHDGGRTKFQTIIEETKCITTIHSTDFVE